MAKEPSVNAQHPEKNMASAYPETEIERNLRIARMLREKRSIQTEYDIEAIINENRRLKAENLRLKQQA
jgi:hypothetical protein|uniref:Uncharacterized protein n=1 Tax=Siphoviridae sp. ctwHj1 TaxID=2825727 RepID=A0A8S5U646_9CAUD|nr:MAG TPA: hypothetical protein [Siphoviridae sp. ctwHj1]